MHSTANFLDSYERLFSSNLLNKDQLFRFGISETIFVDVETATREWELLKERIRSGNKVYIRGFGRNAKGSHLFQKLYSVYFGNENVITDPSNNMMPTRLLREWTGYSKTKSNRYKLIKNYQACHIFGRTKNVFLFTAPWNIAYVPKIVDPLTGHEAHGPYAEEYSARFKDHAFKLFSNLIEEYNTIITCPLFMNTVEKAAQEISDQENLSDIERDRLLSSVKFEFSELKNAL